MTCCVDDIQFAGLVCNYENTAVLPDRKWATLTAKISIENHKVYGRKGPVLNVLTAVLTSAADPEVATFN